MLRAEFILFCYDLYFFIIFTKYIDRLLMEVYNVRIGQSETRQATMRQ